MGVQERATVPSSETWRRLHGGSNSEMSLDSGEDLDRQKNTRTKEEKQESMGCLGVLGNPLG